MNDAKRHHFIPEMIQRNFADEDGQLWFHRPEFGMQLKPSRPGNLFVIGGMNTIHEEDGSRNISAEHLYSHVESLATPFLEQVLASARRGVAPLLSQGAWDFWHIFYYLHWKRGPLPMQQYASEIDLEAVLRETVDNLEAAGMVSDPEELAQMRTKEFLARQFHNSIVASRAQLPDESIKAFFASKGLAIFRIDPKLRRSFVLGDIVIARARLRSPTFMPIAPDIALGFTDRRGEVLIVQLVERQDVKMMNCEMARQSTMIAAADYSLLDSVVKAVR